MVLGFNPGFWGGFDPWLWGGFKAMPDLNQTLLSPVLSEQGFPALFRAQLLPNFLDIWNEDGFFLDIFGFPSVFHGGIWD